MTEQEVKAQVIIGKDAEDFKESELGKVVLGLAEQDVRLAVDDFSTVDASDLAKVREIQLRIRLGLKFERYLDELITNGREAFETYKQQKEEG